MTDTLRAIRRTSNPGPGPCSECEQPATCYGVYEDPSHPVVRACSDCCAHGNEDGWCERLECAECEAPLLAETAKRAHGNGDWFCPDCIARAEGTA